MKLLFDQNLSHRLVRLLADVYPDCLHVRDIGLNAATDTVIWDYTKTNGYMIVSKDSDFHQRSFVFGYPPKVIGVTHLGPIYAVDVPDRIGPQCE